MMAEMKLLGLTFNRNFLSFANKKTTSDADRKYLQAFFGSSTLNSYPSTFRTWKVYSIKFSLILICPTINNPVT